MVDRIVILMVLVAILIMVYEFDILNHKLDQMTLKQNQMLSEIHFKYPVPQPVKAINVRLKQKKK